MNIKSKNSSLSTSSRSEKSKAIAKSGKTRSHGLTTEHHAIPVSGTSASRAAEFIDNETLQQPLLLQGHFDLISDGFAEGWTFNSARPEDRLTVEILEGDRVVARGVADLPREDLEKAGIGDGRHHFKLQLSFELKDGQPHELVAKVRGTTHLLVGSPKTYQTEVESPGDFELTGRASTLQLARQLFITSYDEAACMNMLAQVENANLALEMYDIEGSIQSFQMLQRAYGFPTFFHVKIAEAYMLANRFEEAACQYLEAIKHTPTYSWAYLGLGNAHRMALNWIEAENSYRKAQSLQSNSAVIKYRLASVLPQSQIARGERLLNEGNYDDAISVLKSVLAQYPNNLAAFRLLKIVQANKNGTAVDVSPVSEHLQAFELAELALNALLDIAQKSLDEET